MANVFRCHGLKKEQWLPMRQRVIWRLPWKCIHWFVIQLPVTWLTYVAQAKGIINNFIYLVVVNTSKNYWEGWLMFHNQKEAYSGRVQKTRLWLLANPTFIFKLLLLLPISITEAQKTDHFLPASWVSYWMTQKHRSSWEGFWEGTGMAALSFSLWFCLEWRCDVGSGAAILPRQVWGHEIGRHAVVDTTELPNQKWQPISAKL